MGTTGGSAAAAAETTAAIGGSSAPARQLQPTPINASLIRDCGRRVNDWSGKTSRFGGGKKGSRIYFGHNMTIDQAPWAVFLWGCSGSIIDESWILTDAHCVG